MPEKISMTWYFWLWHDIVCWQRDVMSVHLEGGHVVFQYSFHGRPSVRLQSRHRYNRNKWVTVVASRMKLEGMSHVALGQHVMVHSRYVSLCLPLCSHNLPL